MTDIGHNSGERLRSFVERLERLQEEKAAITADISEVFKEAKGVGFDTTIIKAILKERKADASKLAEYNALLDAYRAALGMLDGTPLGDAALGRVGQ